MATIAHTDEHRLFMSSIMFDKDERELSTSITNYAVHAYRWMRYKKETIFLFECNVDEELGIIKIIKLERWNKEFGSFKQVLGWGLTECKDEEDWYDKYDVTLPMEQLLFLMGKKSQ